MPSENRRKQPGSRRVDRPNRLRPLRGTWLFVALCAALAGCRTLSRQGPVPQSVATARQLTQQGITAKDRGDWQRAEALLGRAVQTNPTDPDARRNYAETLWHRGALPEALQQLEKARRVAAEDPALAVRTGELHLALGQINYANRMADEAMELDPKFAPAWALRGRVAGASGQTRQALADYQRSLGYAPDSREVAILVAEAYRRLNEPERALVALQRLADSYSPGEEPQQVLYLEGLALMALGRNDDAVQSLSKAATRDGPTPDLLCQLAEAELRSGRFASAQATLQQALALDPGHAASQTLRERLAAVQPVSGHTIQR
jgi:Flp pilus assembly protein TadD